LSVFNTPFGDIPLERYPPQPRQTLQAYCSADALLLEALAANERIRPCTAVLVVNDEHGAISITARKGGFQPTLWTDSALSQQAVHGNAQDNAQEEPALVWSTETPPTTDTVLMRVPKHLPFFKYQLAILSSQLTPGVVVEIAGMDKHLSPRTGDIIERYLGPVTRHRGSRKARRFTAIVAKPARSAQSPRIKVSRYSIEAPMLNMQSLPNVFSGDRLDGGSALLLQSLPVIEPADELIDLACGNGVLGLSALAMGIASSVTFCDESAMAIESARRNCAQLAPTGQLHIQFHHGDGLLGVTTKPDLILCNPPFHLHHVVDEFAGQRLLRQCAQSLRSGGRLLLVANRHLKYAPLLRRQFDRVERLNEDKRFIVWQAIAG